MIVTSLYCQKLKKARTAVDMLLHDCHHLTQIKKNPNKYISTKDHSNNSNIGLSSWLRTWSSSLVIIRPTILAIQCAKMDAVIVCCLHLINFLGQASSLMRVQPSKSCIRTRTNNRKFI